MTWLFSTNNRFYDNILTNSFYNSDRCLFLFKEFMKTAGWTVPQSCDGISLNQDGNDLITSALSGSAGGIGGQSTSNSAWFILRSPDGVKEFLFCRAADYNYSSNSIAGHLGWILGYSASQKFSTTSGIGGNPVSITNPPLAIDSVWVSATSQTTLFSKPNSQLYYNEIGLRNTQFWNAHFIVNNEFPYNWYLVCTPEPTVSTNITTFWFFDYMNYVGLNYDNDPYVLGQYNYISNPFGSICCWINKPSSFSNRGELVQYQSLSKSIYATGLTHAKPLHGARYLPNNKKFTLQSIGLSYQKTSNYLKGFTHSLKYQQKYLNPYQVIKAGDNYYLTLTQLPCCIPWNSEPLNGGW